MSGAEVTAGTLDVERTGERIWQDISRDTAGNPRTIDQIGSFRTVPGDTVLLTEKLELTLNGDNLEAEVLVNAEGLTGELAATGALWAEYRVLGPDGTVVPNGEGRVTGGTFQDFSLSLDEDSDGVYTIQLQITFNDLAANQVGVTRSALLQDLVITLQQKAR